MQFLTTVTQKGQITIPKEIRDQLNIKEYNRVFVSVQNKMVVVEPVKDIMDFAGKLRVPKSKRGKDPRVEFEKNYKRF